MKLERFYAESMSQAMVVIQKKLGNDAVIYSHTKKNDYIEVVAGVPKLDAREKNIGTTATQPAEQNKNLRSKSIIHTSLDNRMVQIRKLDTPQLNQELLNMEKRNLLYRRMCELKFSHDFIERFVDSYSIGADVDSIQSDEQIIKMLLANTKVAENEFIDESKICAVVGPTGVGKSTTIAKLAKRFISRYGSDSLGIISTDFQRIMTKNQFYYFGQLLNVQVEYASDMLELQQSIHLLDNKKLILIDTAGVSQFDNKKIAALFDEVSVDGEPIALYLVLPCNLQTDVLDEVATNFNMEHTKGCIITKKDECRYIAPCLGVAIAHGLPVSYVCHGQNISRDIEAANKLHLVNDVFSNT